MKINSNIKTEIYILEIEKRYDDIIKKLQKIKMSATEYDCIDTDIFINYNLAKSFFKTGNKEFANHYLSYIKEIFENQQVYEDRKFEYYNYLWLYSDVNKDDMTREEYYKNFIEIYRYYIGISDSRFSDKAIQNIILADDKKEKIISFLKSVIDEYGKDDEIIQNLVVDCKKFDNLIYITLNEYLYKEDRIAI